MAGVRYNGPLICAGAQPAPEKKMFKRKVLLWMDAY